MQPAALHSGGGGGSGGGGAGGDPLGALKHVSKLTDDKVGLYKFANPVERLIA
jgi:hypothetical protein